MRTKKDYFIKFAVIFLISLIYLNVVAKANIRLPAIVNDNMVLQQNTAVPLWGWADANEIINIKVSWKNTAFKMVADSNGEWKIKIETPSAGGPYEIIISNDKSYNRTIKNVAIGEVWLCSGQSNMEMRVRDVYNSLQEINSANYPDIRLFYVERKSSQEPQSDCNGLWNACDPQIVKNFSAVGYFFGRELHKKLGVPIGLIDSSWGGTPAEAWTEKKILESDPNFEIILDEYNEILKKFPQAKQNYERQLKEWYGNNGIGTKPLPPMGPSHYKSPYGLYNAMIKPLIPYGIKGVIWYQGESNRLRADQYSKLFPAMIKNWRDNWQQGDFPFYYVQIAPLNYTKFNKDEGEHVCAELQEAQLKTLSIPNVGMVVTTDIGDLNDIHPKNKQDVGKRLSLWALAKTYGKKDIVCSGPLYKSMNTESDKIRIKFNCTGSGLTVNGDKLNWFTIAGQDRKFVPANAVIDRNDIVVWSEEVKSPVAVRFGWSMLAQPNLFNNEGLPASPFRTDDWPAFKFDKK